LSSRTGSPSAEQRRRAWVRLRDYRTELDVQQRLARRDGALTVVLLRAALLARREPPC
jgi:hypothetical protein